MIASAFYWFVTSLNDRGWPEVKLHFVRTYDKKEIDFILTLNEKPILAIEAKLVDTKFSPQLRRFRKAVDGKFPILQVVSQPGIFLKKGHGEYLVGYDRLLMVL
ncbi:MAG: hypothetical protein U9N60_03405 [Thermodesulfobacteriota bacterium]|nr:hypothetical protein [Thermodesulfobacteriota bacterium]